MTNNNPAFVTACIEANNQLISELIEEIDSQPIETLKGKEKKRMYSFLRNINRPPKVVVHHNFSKLLKIALVAIFILVVLTVTAFAFDSFRHYFIKNYSNGTELVFNGTSDNDYPHASYDCHLKGYQLIENKKSKYSQYIVYSNEDGAQINILTDLNGAVIGLDTEHGDLQKVSVNGKDAFGIELEDVIVLTWSSGKYTTYITAETNEKSGISIDDLIKIAESRKKVK